MTKTKILPNITGLSHKHHTSKRSSQACFGRVSLGTAQSLKRDGMIRKLHKARAKPAPGSLSARGHNTHTEEEPRIRKQ